MWLPGPVGKFSDNLASACNPNIYASEETGALLWHKSQEETCFKKAQHHLSFLNKEDNPRKTLVLLTLPLKPQPLCGFKEGKKEGKG
jgi:hypothetical protein